VVDKANKQIVR